MRTLVRRIRAVPLRDWPAICAAVAVAVIVEIGLRTTTLPRLAARLGIHLVPEHEDAPMPSMTQAEPDLTPRARRQFRSSLRVIRHWPFGDTCLRRTLVSGQRLRRYEPALQIGVARIDGSLRIHAWLEIQGKSLDPGSDMYGQFTTVGG